MALHILLLDQQWQFYPIEEIYRWDKRRCLSLSLSTVMLAPVLCCEELRLPVLYVTLFPPATVEALVMEYYITQDQTSWATLSGY